MPIWPGAAYGELLPFTNSSVEFFEYAVYEKNGFRMTRIKLDKEAGSPFMTPAPFSPFDTTPLQPNSRYTWTLGEIPLDRLILRDTAIIDISVNEGHEITPDEMEQAISKADYRRSDYILLRTGWGTLERAYDLGIEYYKRTPTIRYDAGVLLADKMEQMDSGVFMTDCGLVNPARVQGHNWFCGDTPLSPLPKPWPSMEARERAMDLGAKKHASKEPSSYGAIIKKVMAGCKCLVDCDRIRSNRVKMIIMPLLIKNGGAIPCRFVALEED